MTDGVIDDGMWQKDVWIILEFEIEMIDLVLFLAIEFLEYG